MFIFAATFTYSKGLNLGIDFKGGSTITINSKDKISNSKIEKDMKVLEYSVKDIDRVDNNIVTVTVKDVLNTTSYCTIHMDDPENNNGKTKNCYRNVGRG